MSSSPRIEILARRAGRLLRFRIPLIVAVAFNIVLLVRIPLAEVLPGTRQAPAQPSAVTGLADRPVEPDRSLPEPEPGFPDPARGPSTLASDVEGLTSFKPVPGQQSAADRSAGDYGRAIEDNRSTNSQRSAADRSAGDYGRAIVNNRSTNSQQSGADRSDGRSDPGRLRLVNPAANGGEVRFLINGQSHSLPPGSELVEPAGEPWAIQFHRGDKLGNAMYSLGPGTYTFRVSERGWNLAPAPWHSLAPSH